MSSFDNSNDTGNNDSSTIPTAASASTNNSTDSFGPQLPLRKRVAPAVLKWQPVETPEEQPHHAIDAKPITSTTFVNNNNNNNTLPTNSTTTTTSTTNTTTNTTTTTTTTTTSTYNTYTTPMTAYPLLPQYPTSSTLDSDGGGDTTETDEEKQIKQEANNFLANTNKRMKESPSQTSSSSSSSKPATKKLKRGRPPLNKSLSNSQQHTTPFSTESSPALSSAALPIQQQAKPAAVDNSTLYCICKRPYSADAPRFMIACDKCNEWFHGECIEIDEKQSEFIDLYYCDNCSKLTGKKTSWKPKCANPACTRPARIGTNQGHLSKYCTDSCGMQVARARIELAEIKKRNALRANSADGADMPATTIVHSSPTTTSTDNLTNTAFATASSSASLTNTTHDEQQVSLHQQLYNPLSRLKLSSFADLDDRARLMRVKDEKSRARYMVQLVGKKSKFLNMVLQHHEKRLKGKGICGFDSRLNWSDSTWDKIHDITVEQDEDESMNGTAETDSNCHYIFKDEQGHPIYAHKAYYVCQQAKKCNKHADWQRIKQTELEQDRSEQFVILTMLERERQQIKARMKKRREEVDLVEYLENGTITHFR